MATHPVPWLRLAAVVGAPRLLLVSVSAVAAARASGMLVRGHCLMMPARSAVTASAGGSSKGSGCCRCSAQLQSRSGHRVNRVLPALLPLSVHCLTARRLSSSTSALPRWQHTSASGGTVPGTSGAWTAKRPLRKNPTDKNSKTAAVPGNRPKLAGNRHPDVYPVVAYATAEEYSLQFLAEDLTKQGLYKLHQLPSDVPDVLYASSVYATSAEPRELFVFREGTVVFWNMEQAEIEAFLQLVRGYELDSYDRQLVTTEQEEMDYSYHEGATKLLQDQLLLRKRLTSSADEQPSSSGRGAPVSKPASVDAGETGIEAEDDEESLALQKYSVSNALSLSVKLSIWEASLNRYVDSIEFVTEDLKRGNKLRMSRRDVLRKTGELFALRHLINLSSDLLDTPDFYWDREKLERLYLHTCAYLNINRRTKVMNEKLSHCCDLTGLLREHLNHNHSARLEWMIIVLIMIEIIFEMIHYIDKRRDSELALESSRT